MTDNETSAARAVMPDAHVSSEGRRALRAVRNLDLLVDDLADALTSCVIRFEDIGQGDSPTAQHARAVLGRAGR